MKYQMKKSVLSMLIAVVMLLTAGCTKSDSQETSNSELPIASVAPTILAETDISQTEDATLFDTIFVPMAQGQISTEKEAFQESVIAYGFSCHEEAGVILVRDPASSDCFIRGEMLNGKEIDSLVYSCMFGNVQKQVRVVGINTGNLTYFIDIANYKPGTQVQSLEDVYAYLSANIIPEETAQPEQETKISLFEDILLPLANGEIENSGLAIQAIVSQKGYYYVNGEGTFVIHDNLHPENYLYGDPMLLDDADSVSILGFHLESDTEVKEVEIHFFASPMKYYIRDPYTSNTTEVETLDELKNHIYQ